MSPPSSPTTSTPSASWTTSRSRSRMTGRGTPSTPRGTACRMTGPWGSLGCQRAASRQRWPSWVHSSYHRSTSVRAEVTKMFCEIASAHRICPEVKQPVPELATLEGGNWVHCIPRALAALGVGLYNPIACPRAAHVQLQSPPCNIVTLRTAKLRHRDTCRVTVPDTTPWHGHHRRHHPFPDNNARGQPRCGNASTSAPMNTSTIAAASRSPATGPVGATLWSTSSTPPTRWTPA